MRRSISSIIPSVAASVVAIGGTPAAATASNTVAMHSRGFFERRADTSNAAAGTIRSDSDSRNRNRNDDNGTIKVKPLGVGRNNNSHKSGARGDSGGSRDYSSSAPGAPKPRARGVNRSDRSRGNGDGSTNSSNGNTVRHRHRRDDHDGASAAASYLPAESVAVDPRRHTPLPEHSPRDGAGTTGGRHSGGGGRAFEHRAGGTSTTTANMAGSSSLSYSSSSQRRAVAGAAPSMVNAGDASAQQTNGSGAASIPTTKIDRWAAALRAFLSAPMTARTPSLAFSTLHAFKQAILQCEYEEHKALRITMRKKYGQEAFGERYLGEDAMKARVAAQFTAEVAEEEEKQRLLRGELKSEASAEACGTSEDELASMLATVSAGVGDDGRGGEHTSSCSNSSTATTNTVSQHFLQQRMSQQRLGNYSDWDDADELLECNPQTSALLEAFASFRLAAISEEYGLTPFEQSELYKRAIHMLVESEDKAMSRGHLKGTGDTSNSNTTSANSASNNNRNNSQGPRGSSSDPLAVPPPLGTDFDADRMGGLDGDTNAVLVRRQKLPPTSFVLQAIACISEAKLMNVPLTVGHYLPILKCPLVAEIDKDLPMRLLADAATAVADTLAQAGRDEPTDSARKAVFRAQVAAAGTYATTGNWQQALLLCNTDPTFAALVKSLVDSNQWPWAYYLASQVTTANVEQYLRSVSIAEAYSATARAAVEYGMRVTFANANPIAAKINTSNRHDTARVTGVTEGFSTLGGPVGATREAMLSGQSRNGSNSNHTNGNSRSRDARNDNNGRRHNNNDDHYDLDIPMAPPSSSGANAGPAQPVDPAAIKLYMDFSDPAACAFAVENATRYAENQVAPYNCLPPAEVQQLYGRWLALTHAWVKANAHHPAMEGAGSGQQQQQNHHHQQNNSGDGRLNHTPKFLTRHIVEPLILSAPPGDAIKALALFPCFARHYYYHIASLDEKIQKLEAQLNNERYMASRNAGGSGGRGSKLAGGGGGGGQRDNQQQQQVVRQLERERMKAVGKRSEIASQEVIPLGIILRSLHRSCEWRTIIRFYCDTVLRDEHCDAAKVALINAFAEKIRRCDYAIGSSPSSPSCASANTSHEDLVSVLLGGADEVGGGDCRYLPLRPNVLAGDKWHPADEAHVLLSLGQAILCMNGDAPDLSLIVAGGEGEEGAGGASASSGSSANNGGGSCDVVAAMNGKRSGSRGSSSVNDALDARLREAIGDTEKVVVTTPTPPTPLPFCFTPKDVIAFSNYVSDSNSHKHMALLHILSRGGRGCPAGSEWLRCETALQQTDAMSNIFIDLFTWQMMAAGYFHKGNTIFEDFMRRRKRRSVQLGSHNHNGPRWPIFSYLMLSTGALRYANVSTPSPSSSSATAMRMPLRSFVLQQQQQTANDENDQIARNVASLSSASAPAALLRLIEIGTPRIDAWAVVHSIACLLCAVVEVPNVPEGLLREEREFHDRMVACWARHHKKNRDECGGEGDDEGQGTTTTLLGSAFARVDDDSDAIPSARSGSSRRGQQRSPPMAVENDMDFFMRFAHAAVTGPHRPLERPITYTRIRKYVERQAIGGGLKGEYGGGGGEGDYTNAEEDADGALLSAAVRSSGRGSHQSSSRGKFTPLPPNASTVANVECLANEHVQQLLALLRSGKVEALRPRTQTEYNNLMHFFIKQTYAVIKYYSEVSHASPSDALCQYIHNHDDLRACHMGMLRRFPHEVPEEEMRIAPTVRERVQFRMDACGGAMVAIIKELAVRRSGGARHGGGGGSCSSFATTNVIAAAVRKGFPLPMDSFLD